MSAGPIAHDPGAPPPRVKTLRLVGPAAGHARGRFVAPLGATFLPDAEAQAVALGPADVADVASVARALPDPDSLGPGVLVVVLPNVVEPPSLGGRLLAVLGRGRTVSRALRSSALVSRGYVRVAAGIDVETRTDLVWGFSPTEPC
ncbi:MAG TPA: hypothetical protein VLT33_45390 [Labilithrix sp.]|nr:hypothetical protein [Labilithrix sp.]